MEEDDSVETLDPIVDAERARQLSLFRPLGKEPVKSTVPFPVLPSLAVIYPLHLAMPLPRWFLLCLPLIRRAIALCMCSLASIF